MVSAISHPDNNLPDEGWVPVSRISELLNIPRRTLQYRCQTGFYGQYQEKRKGARGEEYYIHIYSPEIPAEIRSQLLPASEADENFNRVEVQAEIFATLNAFQQKYVSKFLTLYHLTKGKEGTELKDLLKQYRDLHGKDAAWAYSTFMQIRKNYEANGLSAIVPKWGVHRRGEFKAPDEPFEVFKREYMTQRRASAYESWKQAVGFAKRSDPANFDFKTFPSHSSFLRRLEAEVSKSAIYLARYGYAAWNQIYGYSIRRDFSNVLAGECWVSDHAQSDVMVTTPDGKTRFLWITVWCDAKTRKWLGWHIHVDPPCTEDIFTAFYNAASVYGLPTQVIVDNGKDFRSIALTGGRRSWGKIKIEHDERKCIALFGLLDIVVHFSWPYNPQSKPIELSFHIVNTKFSRHLIGYRGPDIYQRPETLLDEKRAGKLWTEQEFITTFNTFVKDIYNKEKYESGMHKGLRPDEIWDKEYPAAVTQGRVRHISKSALAMYCAMPSKPNRIKNCKFTCKTLGIEFTAPWMTFENGTLAYYRGDSNDLSEVSFWEYGASQRYLGKAVLDTGSPGLAFNETDKTRLASRIELKRQKEKQIRKLARVVATENNEYLENRKAYVEAVNQADGYAPAQPHIVEEVIATEMDRVLTEEKRRSTAGKFDYTEAVKEDEKGSDIDDLDIWNLKAVGF